MPEDHVLIFDTTLRDGEQSRGGARVRKAPDRRMLERMGVDIIEARLSHLFPGI